MGSSRQLRHEDAAESRTERIQGALNSLYSVIDGAVWGHAIAKDAAKKYAIIENCHSRCARLINTLEQLGTTPGDTLGYLLHSFERDAASPPGARVIVPGITLRAYRDSGVRECIIATLRMVESGRSRANGDVGKILRFHARQHVRDERLAGILLAFVRKHTDFIATLRYIKDEYAHYYLLHRQCRASIRLKDTLSRYHKKVVTKSQFLTAVRAVFRT